MNKTHLAVLLTSIAVGHSSHAAGYATDFEDPPFDSLGEIEGTDGWLIDTGPDNVSFVVQSWDPDDTGPLPASQAAGLGGFFDTPTAGAPAASAANLTHAISLPLTTVDFDVDFAIIEADMFPGQDSFGFSVSDSGLALPLFRIAFEPPGNNGDLEVAWYDDAGTRNLITPISQDIFYDKTYHLSLDFAPSGAGDAGFTAMLSGTNSVTFSGVLTGRGANVVDSIGADFDIVDDADNYMIFDNLSVVPEPSSTLLLVGGIAGCLLRRRRQ